MTVTKPRMTALASTTRRGSVVGILASLRECGMNVISATSLDRNQFPGFYSKQTRDRAVADFSLARRASGRPNIASSPSKASIRSSRGTYRELGVGDHVCGVRRSVYRQSQSRPERRAACRAMDEQPGGLRLSAVAAGGEMIGAGAQFARLSAGGRWIRTSGTAHDARLLADLLRTSYRCDD